MLPQAITALRSHLGWSMSRLAQALDVDVNWVVDWESGERFPTKKHHLALVALRDAHPPDRMTSVRRRSSGEPPTEPEPAARENVD